jgi:hypothetical protein
MSSLKNKIGILIGRLITRCYLHQFMKKKKDLERKEACTLNVLPITR